MLSQYLDSYLTARENLALAEPQTNEWYVLNEILSDRARDLDRYVERVQEDTVENLERQIRYACS